MVGSANTLIDKKGGVLIPRIVDKEDVYEYYMKLPIGATIVASGMGMSSEMAAKGLRTGIKFISNKYAYVDITFQVPKTNPVLVYNGSSVLYASCPGDQKQLPYKFDNGSAIVYNDEIYLIGGAGSPSSQYKLNTNGVWEYIRVDNPYSIYLSNAVVLNDEIHILGGSYGTKNHYKWTGSAWVNVSTLPYEFARGRAVVLNNKIYILGGIATASLKLFYSYDPTTNVWTALTQIPYNFYDGAAVVYNNEIHIFGSSSGENYTKHYKWSGSAWVSVSTIPFALYDGAAVVYNSEIHIMSEQNHYKWNGSVWEKVATLPYRFTTGGGLVYRDRIHLIGGSTNPRYDYIYDGRRWDWDRTPTNKYQLIKNMELNGVHTDVDAIVTGDKNASIIQY